jgi:hypothetical protein
MRIHFAKTRRTNVVCLFLATCAAVGSQAQAGDYDWVMPPVYTFGSCGGQGEDSVPGYANQKYFSKHQCREAFDPRKCHALGLIYERRFHDSRTTECGNWLRQEVSNCQSFVSSASRQCDELAK